MKQSRIKGTLKRERILWEIFFIGTFLLLNLVKADSESGKITGDEDCHNDKTHLGEEQLVLGSRGQIKCHRTTWLEIMYYLLLELILLEKVAGFFMRML